MKKKNILLAMMSVPCMLGAMDIRGPLTGPVWLELFFIQALQENDIQEMERCLIQKPALVHHAHIQDYLCEHKPSSAFVALLKKYEEIDRVNQQQVQKQQQVLAAIKKTKKIKGAV